MFLRRLFRKKCQEYKCENPFNTDVDFELLPLRQKVEILRALCDFRLDAEDVEESLSNLDSDSLRVEPLGHDRKNSAYWYFYGTRLYREDYIDTSNSASHKQKGKPRDKKRKKRRNRVAKEEQEEEEKEEAGLINGNNRRQSVWQVVCFTQQDWSRLVEKFRDSEYDTERKLYRTLSEDFMPEIPKLFDLKEKQQRRKLLQRNSSRVLRSQEPTTQMDAVMVKSKIRTKTTKGAKKGTQASKSYIKEVVTPPPLLTPPVQKKGRQTNNSLASAVGQIVIHTRDEVEDLEKKKGIGSHGDGNYVPHNYGYKYGYSFGIEEEERCVGMHKVLESVKDHVDAWPFIEPVDEDYAPRYYSVVRRPMDLKTMEEKLENGSYKSLSQFKRDFRLIVDNCRQYNGSDNEYTDMAINLKEAFDKAVKRYLESETSSDEDAASRSLNGSPTSLSHPSRNLSSSHHNARKRSKKSTKKSKLYKSESTTKSKSNEKVDEDEKRNKSIKVAKKKRGKKKSKKMKEEESEEDEEEQEDQESEDAISETSIVTSKRRKNIDVNNLLKTKKLPKESEELKTSKKASKERHQSKKDSEIVRSTKEVKENKKRKEDFEEDYEPPIIAKSKSRKIEKKELEETTILTDNTKKSKLKKIEVEESDTVFEQDKKQSSHIKTKKNRKKEKSNLKTKSAEKSNKNHIKQKNKKSKQKKQELKNGELKSQTDPKDIELDNTLDSKHAHNSKKLSTLIGNKDVDSLDSLKDKISDRRREEKLKNEKEKRRKAMKNDIHGVHSKKVPSNSSTFHDNDKDSAKRSKSRKSTKEDKIADDAIKKNDPEVSENKKNTHAKHTKGLKAEENAAIQALNQATEKTLHDINKWLDDTPKFSEFSSGSDSPVLQTSSVESSRSGSKIEATRKRPSSMKIFGPHGPSRPKKIQRTIDRLQPGKSKGNLLLKKPLNVSSANTNDTTINLNSDNDQSNKDNDEEPKLSLGTVLKNVDSIQLICKSLVSSPNPNLSNDDDEEDHSLIATQASNVKEEKTNAKEATKTLNTVEEKEAARTGTEETQKPKSATPNLSAWFKAFGAPKSKKKDEEAEEATMLKKDGDSQEAFCGRQRRLSTGGSSVSESVSSFSQESPPAPRAPHSPQCQPVITPTEPIRGAGFYQDALSTGSSPYNSPYYATPPRYSAQLPPTPSPQHHPLSPAYTSSYEQPPPVYPHVHAQPPYQSPYQKSSPQDSTNEAYPQMSPQRFSQQLPANSQNQSPVYPQHSPQAMQPVYPQPSPQTPPSNYSQPSPQQPSTPNYSQPSPQQNAVANYSQSSPQAIANYPQASPQQQHSPYSQTSPQTPPNYSQTSPQQQHSPYAQSSPQQPSAGYSRLSPQPPPANYSQPSPQPPNAYPQPSPQPPGFSSQSSPQTRPANYLQSSPQPPSPYPTPQHDRSYSQSSHQQIQTFPQHSPQASSPFSNEPSPQNSPYSQSSPQSLTNYPQSSPQQPATYSHPLHSPQTPPNYSQLSPQQTGTGTAATTATAPTAAAAAVAVAAVNYSQPSPQQSRNNYPQTSPQQKPTCNPAQPSQQSPGYSQSSPQQTTNYSQLQSSKNSEEYVSQATSAPPASYPQDFKQNPSQYIQQSPTISSSVNEAEHRTEYLKQSNATEKSPVTGDQQRSFPVQSESLNLNTNHQIYQSPSQYPPSQYPNSFSNIELQRSASRHGGQQQTQQQQQQQQQQSTSQESRTSFTEIQSRGFLGKTPSGSGDQLPASAPDQTQLLAFQQNLTTAHESLYPGGFQPSSYSLPPPSNSRPVYPSPHYFDASKSTGSGGGGGSAGVTASPSNNPPPMKKRAYEPSSESSARGLPQESAATRPSQEQFSNFEPMMALSQPPEAVSVSQYDSTPFVGGLADSMATNSAYARLSLGLVGRPSGKEQQQLLTIPRPPPGTKPEHLAAYGRGVPPSPAELEQLNLLQSLQNAKSSQSILAMSRRAGESDVRATTTTTSKTKRSRKSKHPQQQQEQASTAVTATAATTTTVVAAAADQQQTAGMPAFPQYAVASATESIGALKTAAVVPPPAGSAFNFAATAGGATAGHAPPPFPYDKDATAAAAFAFLTDEFRNPGSYYMALRQQQQQQQQQPQPMVPPTVVSSASGQPTTCNKLGNQPSPRNYPPPPHSFLHSAAAAAAAQRSYVPPVSAYVTPHGPNLTVDQAAYQQYIHSLYALQPSSHHHRSSWL
ncbi:PHD finger protein rhinoceros isoform X2 [Monomorium pharaonis]|nr:PHD finger protein rhinoceros isoform X2 [Monomorium pharaonis]